MEINIVRKEFGKSCIYGELSINHVKICDMAECAHSALPAGVYRLSLRQCHQHKRKILSLSAVPPPCKTCHPIEFVGPNTVMPVLCPMLTNGNGACGRVDGTIVVGTFAGGAIIHSAEIYGKLRSRIRKAIARGHEVYVRIS